MTREEHNRRPGRSSKWIRRATRERIYARDGWRCLWCGSSHGLTLDHARPRERGGTNAPRNLLTACHQCNSARKNAPLRAFAESLGGDWKGRLNRVQAARRRRLPPRSNHDDPETAVNTST